MDTLRFVGWHGSIALACVILLVVRLEQRPCPRARGVQHANISSGEAVNSVSLQDHRHYPYDKE
jgi:hypothetical protein